MTRINDFALIIGAMKAGTTSLYRHLAAHPEIAPSRPKEPNFFGSTKWTKGRDWYEARWQDFDPARHAWALEASTHYTKHPMHPKAAARIAAFDARFKFLYIMRDPVDRIESHIAHNVAMGHVTAADHRAMLDRAIAVSSYAAQLERFRAALGTPDILLLDFDELLRDPAALLSRCTRFLGIDERFVFEPRPPANVRKAQNGSESFRLTAEERLNLRTALADDMRRLSDDWGFETAKWGFGEPSPRPPSKPARSPSPVLARAPRPPGKYWERRQGMMYYEYVRALAFPLAAKARSLIDVGSHGTSLAEDFDWIPERVALDLRTPYASEAVRGIQADFLAFEPDRRYDFALCLQVLEHVPEAGAFAQKLLAVADRVLVSVPYRWPEGVCKHHCQDPVDEAKLAAWFGRAPDYRLVVEEPFRDRRNSRRLIAYFHPPGEAFDPKHYRNRAPRGDGAEAARLAQQRLAAAVGLTGGRGR